MLSPPCADAGNPPPPDLAALSADFPLGLHKVLLCTAYNFEQKAVFAEALELAEMRLQAGGHALASPSPSSSEGAASASASELESLAAASALLGAVSRLEQQPGAEALRGMASVALRCCTAPGTSGTAAAGGTAAGALLPDILTDASLVLYMTAKPLLDGAYCRGDKESGLVLEVLRSLHACWEVCGGQDRVKIERLSSLQGWKIYSPILFYPVKPWAHINPAFVLTSVPVAAVTRLLLLLPRPVTSTTRWPGSPSR